MDRLGGHHQILFFCGAMMVLSSLVGELMLLLCWGASLPGRPGGSERVPRLLLPENLMGDLPSFSGQNPGQKVRHGGI